MVSPSPYLENKMRNTEFLIRSGNSHLISHYSKAYPHDYLDVDTYNRLMTNKPWAEHSGRKEVKKEVNLQEILVPVITDSDRILVLLVDFSDKPATISKSVIKDRFFGSDGYTFKNFYTENSYGLYIPEGMVYGWYRMPQTYSYYIGGNNGIGAYPQNARKMVEDAIDAVANDAAVNLNYIDRNNDGKIDRLMVIHAGGEAAWGGDPNEIWAHMSELPSGKVVRGKTFLAYAVTSEYIDVPGDTQRSGVDIHEYGHILRLPDLYDTTGLSAGIGTWSVMSGGSWGNSAITPVHFDIWCKITLGWASPQINQTGTLTLRNSENYPDCFRYTTSHAMEYFLIENRQNTLFDLYLPGNGMLIWRINDIGMNNNRDCPNVGLIQADNRNDLYYKTNSGDSGDTYPGSTNNRVFSKDSAPNAQLCDGTPRDITLDQISDSSVTMTLRSQVTCLVATVKFTVT